jgi:hypothetical protein
MPIAWRCEQVGHFDARRPQVVRLRQALTTHSTDIAGEAPSMRVGTADLSQSELNRSAPHTIHFCDGALTFPADAARQPAATENQAWTECDNR